MRGQTWPSFHAGIEKLRDARDELERTGRLVWIYPFDMGDVEKIDALYSRVIEDTGGIDILVNNAGGTRRNMPQDVTLEDWSFVINLNPTSLFILSRASGKERIKTGRPGKIVNIASLLRRWR